MKVIQETIPWDTFMGKLNKNYNETAIQGSSSTKAIIVILNPIYKETTNHS